VNTPLLQAESRLAKWRPKRPRRINCDGGGEKFLFFSIFVAPFTLEIDATEENCTESGPFRCSPPHPLLSDATTVKGTLPMVEWPSGRITGIFIFPETTSFGFRIQATTLPSIHSKLYNSCTISSLFENRTGKERI
jgi:hypothetical protein